MEDYIILLVLWITASCIIINSIKELYFTIKDIGKDKYVYGNENHSIEHILFLAFSILGQFGFYGWLLLHGGAENHFEKHLLGQGLAYILIFNNIAGLFLLYHLSKERNHDAKI